MANTTSLSPIASALKLGLKKPIAAIGMADDKSGEVVKIFVVKKDESLTKEEIIEHCKANLTGYKVPKSVQWAESLPKTNVGKILRRELR